MHCDIVEISKEGRGGSLRAAFLLRVFCFKRAREHAQRIHLHFNKHFLCLVVSFSHLLPARKTSSVWLWHPCLMQAAAQTTQCLLGTVNFQVASLALSLRKKMIDRVKWLVKLAWSPFAPPVSQEHYWAIPKWEEKEFASDNSWGRTGEGTQLAECLPCVNEVPSSVPSPPWTGCCSGTLFVF